MNKAIFIDKDGTLIENIPYNVDPNRVILKAGVLDFLRRAEEFSYKIYVVTNQSGIARGYFSQSEFSKVQETITSLCKSRGVHLNGWYICPHHPQGIVSQYAKECSCRKPQPGLLIQAAKQNNIDLSKSWMIGDILDDVEAGNRAGCRSVLFESGGETEWILSEYRYPDNVVRSFEELTALITLFTHPYEPVSANT